MKLRFAAAALSLALLNPFAATADVPAGGIGGLAVSPDGATILVAGDSRAIYVLDPTSMEVKNRVHTGTTVVWMTFRQDGKAFFMRDTSGLLSAHDAGTFERLWSVDRTETVDYALPANLLTFTVREQRDYVAKVIDATSFQEKGTYPLGEKFYPGAQGISLDGLKTVVLSRSEKRESEEKKRADSSLRGIERSLFNQQHDQRGARIAEIDLTTGSVNMVESWYRSDNVRGMKVSLTDTYVLSFSEEMANIKAGGEVTIIPSGARNHYAATMTPDMSAIVSGSLRSITMKKLDSDVAQELKLNSLPGWPEYLSRFTFLPDGRLLAGTTAYRVIVVSPDGKMTAHPVF